MRTVGGGKRYAGKPSCRLAGGVCRSSICPRNSARGVCRSTICSCTLATSDLVHQMYPCTLATGDLVHQMCPRDLATGDLVHQMCSRNLATGDLVHQMCSRDLATGDLVHQICSRTLATGDLVHQMCSRDLATGDLVYQMCSCNLFRSFREMFQCWFKHCCQTNQSKSVLSSSWRCFLRRFFDLASASDVLLKTASCSLRENCHFSRQQISCSWRVRLYFSCKDESVLLNNRSVKANKVSHSWRERLVCCGSSFNCKRSDKPGCSVSADESCLICCSQIRIFCR